MVVQKNPESDKILSHINQARTVHGNSSYSNMTINVKQIGIFEDSMIKRIIGRRISKDINYGNAKIRPLVGATADEVVVLAQITSQLLHRKIMMHL